MIVFLKGSASQLHGQSVTHFVRYYGTILHV